MTILVTGATGLLGNNIVRDLLAQGESVRILARDPSVSRPFEGLQVERVPGDVRDRAAIAAAVRGTKLVIHSAGHVHIGWSQADLHTAINVEGTQNLAEAAREEGVRMIYVSSVNALGLGGRDFEADEETARPGIVACPYVTSKAQGEDLVLQGVAQGLDATIVCPGFMLGPWDWKPSSGRMMLEVTQRFLPLAPVGSFNVCDVRDVSAGTIAAARQGHPGRRYILGGHNLSYFELWKKMASLAGKRGPLFPAGPLQRMIGGWLGDMRYRFTGREPDMNSAAVGMSSQHHRFRSNRAIAELGYKIRPLDDTLRDAWEWFIEYGYLKPVRR
jgi:dihydroflavonol-4-reductase